MNSLKSISFFMLMACSCFAQEKIKLTDRLFSADMSSTFHYIQGRFSWTPSNLIYGIQYKRQKSDNEAGVFTFYTGQTFSLNYTKLNDQELLNSNLETHVKSYPFTAGIIRIGVGVDYTTNFRQTNFFSVYPSIGLDIDGIEIIYTYLINGYKSYEISDHRICLAIGLWVSSKKKWGTAITGLL